MTVALRVMGNLVTDEDRDLTARAWRSAGGPRCGGTSATVRLTGTVRRRSHQSHASG